MILSEKVALVTGATAGIGFHTANGLARLGATVYITGRDTRRGEEAQRRIRQAAVHGRVYFVRSDASTVGGNQELAQELTLLTDRLDILVNNVGGTYNDRWLTRDVYEATLAMNFVGPFALTEELLPLLRASAPSRIVNIASAAIGMWKGDPFEDPHSMGDYLASDAYARAKFLNVLWTFALARRLRGTTVVANALHPGLSWTAMTAATRPRGMPPWARFVWPLVRLMQRMGSSEKAARVPVLLASDPEAADVTGMYYDSNGRPGRLPPALLDPGMQEHAWAFAEHLTRSARTALTASAMAI